MVEIDEFVKQKNRFFFKGIKHYSISSETYR